MSGERVLIAFAAASVNPIDWKVCSGDMRKDFPLTFPAIISRNASGVVRVAGPNAKHLTPGD
jgi:NADPH:quinone reductase-like Zn-dependent oxidoreductase